MPWRISDTIKQQVQQCSYSLKRRHCNVTAERQFPSLEICDFRAAFLLLCLEKKSKLNTTTNVLLLQQPLLNTSSRCNVVSPRAQGSSHLSGPPAQDAMPISICSTSGAKGAGAVAGRQRRAALLALLPPSLLGSSKEGCTSNQPAQQGLSEVTSHLCSTWWPSTLKASKPHTGHLSGQAGPPGCMLSATRNKHVQAIKYIVAGEHINAQCISLKIFFWTFLKTQGYWTISLFCYGNNAVFFWPFFKQNEICCRALLLIRPFFNQEKKG